MKKSKIIVIDDDPYTLRFVKRILLQEKKYDISLCQTGSEVYDLLRKGSFDYDIAIIDQKLPDFSGLDILKAIKSRNLKTECIMLTAVDDVDIAVKAIKLNAYDYLRKPVDPSKLTLTLQHLMEKKDLIGKIKNLREKSLELKNEKAFKKIITKSRKMMEIFKQIENIANTELPILICGENGTGKSLIAEAIHNVSKNKKEPFVKLNLLSAKKEMLPTILFGKRGKNKGLINFAQKGTLFIEDIAELDYEMQSRLLRVLKNGVYFKEGVFKTFNAKCRFVFSTNKNLFKLIEEGKFRKDLYFIISANIINIPPLRERIGDIEILTNHFIKKYAKANNKNIQDASEEVKTMLKKYNFPGNVRELENIIRSAITIETTNKIRKTSLPEYLLNYFIEENKEEFPTLAEVEKKHILSIFEHTNYNKSHAAKILGITRQTLIKKLKEFGFS